jgi:hypothetical protein
MDAEGDPDTLGAFRCRRCFPKQVWKSIGTKNWD